ncbi:MAG TPA: OB-fold domain-containing protein [Mycobacteriales bacterium]|nr:OB-fold domain-containing protein [Mycobacteriales bacterium]
MATESTAAVLSAPHTMEFAYTRSTGPVVGAFLTGLRDRKVLGAKDSTGRVVVPPPEYDARTAAPTDATALVEVGQEGVVTSWAWNPTPRAGQPFDRPFAWVLVKLDGADTPMLHALDAPREQVETGQRVRVRWADETTGFINDIACFEVIA